MRAHTNTLSLSISVSLSHTYSYTHSLSHTLIHTHKTLIYINMFTFIKHSYTYAYSLPKKTKTIEAYKNTPESVLLHMYAYSHTYLQYPKINK